MQKRGSIIRILYESKESNFAVCLFQSEDGVKEIILGPLGKIEAGDSVLVSGTEVEHPRYGKQFRVEAILKVVPFSEEGLSLYLKKKVRGAGEKRVREFVALWQQWKDDLETLRKKAPPSFPRKVLEALLSKMQEMSFQEKIFLSLLSLGLPSFLAQKIQERYGSRALTVLQENPYALCQEIKGMGFRKADVVARKLGFAQNSPLRLISGGTYLLKKELEEGHLYLPWNAFIKKLAQLLKISEKEISEHEALFQEKPFAREERGIFLQEVLETEKKCAALIASFLKRSPEPYLYSYLDKLESYLKKSSLDPYQQAALKKVFRYPLTLLTGGPGTGKTHTLKTLCAFLEKENIPYELAAPTGRAAKRIQELTLREAKTMHRLLEYDPVTGFFQKNREAPLQTSLVVLDECSMIDLFLFHALLSALPPSCHLCLIGDGDQLPPVGPGSPFRDLLRYERVPRTNLKTIYRQKSSLLVENAHRIIRGQWPDLSSQDRSFLFVETQGSEEVERLLLRYYFQGLEKDLTPFHMQLLSPLYRGAAGVHRLNNSIRMLLYPAAKNKKFVAGDKVIYLVNDYHKGIFNGDIGKVVESGEKSIRVQFQEKTVELASEEQENLALAYALSIHKAQGSEFEIVLLPLLCAHYFFLYRSLLYTAITRARSQCILIGEKKALFLGIRNNREVQRRSALQERLKKGEQEKFQSSG